MSEQSTTSQLDQSTTTPTSSLDDTMKENIQTPNSPKMPSKAAQRRWLRHKPPPVRAASKDAALANQRLLASVRDRYKQLAIANEFTYTQTIQRLSSSLVYEVLRLGGSEVHAQQPVFAEIFNLCLVPGFGSNPARRQEMYQFIEDNIDRLLEGARRDRCTTTDNDDVSEEGNIAPPTSPDMRDGQQFSDFVNAHTSQLCIDTYSSCIFKMRQVQDVIRERAAQRLQTEEVEQNICTNMYSTFKTNASFAHVGCIDNTVDACDHHVPVDKNTCQLCTLVYDATRPAMVLKCCAYKQAVCALCLVRMAFTGSDMGCKSFFACSFCRTELGIYDHLDERPMAEVPLVNSISDNVKQGRRRRVPVERLDMTPVPSRRALKRKSRD